MCECECVCGLSIVSRFFLATFHRRGIVPGTTSAGWIAQKLFSWPFKVFLKSMEFVEEDRLVQVECIKVYKLSSAHLLNWNWFEKKKSKQSIILKFNSYARSMNIFTSFSQKAKGVFICNVPSSNSISCLFLCLFVCQLFVHNFLLYHKNNKMIYTNC